MSTRRGRGRPPREVEASQETEEQRQEREAAEAEARERDAEDDAEDGEDDGDDDHEAGDGEGDPEADLAAVSRTHYDDLQEGGEPAFLDESGDGLSIGAARTPRQNAGIDPDDPVAAAEQASDRRSLLNAQTDHERFGALDAVSGTANPGITREHTHSAPGDLGASDMSGRPAMADPLGNAGPVVREVMRKLRNASADAIQAGKRGQGYLSLRDLNVNKAVMDALVAGKLVTQGERPGGTFNPETGTVYRVADHEEPAPRAK